MQKVGMISGLALGIVFAVLMGIAGILSLFQVLPAFEKRLKARLHERKKAQTNENVPVALNDEGNAWMDEYHDGELVAVIVAAIAAAEETTTDALVIRSIKRRVSNTWGRHL